MCKAFSIIFIFILLINLGAGCASIDQKLRSQTSKNSNEASANEVKDIEIAEKLFSESKFIEAKEKFIDFQKKYPQSMYFQSALLAEGQCSENLGNPERANEIYDSVIVNTQSIHPQIAAIGMFRKSFAYERMGDDLKALTTLLDLKLHQDHLPVEVAQIQLPGRIAMLYNKLGQQNESEKYIQVMNQNIEVNLKGRVSSAQLAESYLLMGSLSSASIHESNISNFSRGFKVSSKFLIKSIESNQNPWSERAMDLLSQQMKDYWNWIVMAGPREGLGKQGLTRRAAVENQQQLAHDFLETLAILDLRRPVEAGQFSELQRKFFAQLDTFQKNTQSLLVDRTELNDLSPESMSMNGLKRKGRLIPVPDSKVAVPKALSTPGSNRN